MSIFLKPKCYAWACPDRSNDTACIRKCAWTWRSVLKSVQQYLNSGLWWWQLLAEALAAKQLVLKCCILAQ